MNQILNQNKIKSKQENTSLNKKIIFKAQFIFSILLILAIIATFYINIQRKNSKEFTSHQISSNYNISKLYSNENSQFNNLYNQNGQSFTVIGMIEIPKINIFYPIISESNDELLKISPCRISGPMPNENGNLCIAGHNYDNYKFFSKLVDLDNRDEIFIYDLKNNKLPYNIFEINEVKADDLSPLNITQGIKKQVTLITCNNFKSNNRIIIKAYSKL